MFLAQNLVDLDVGQIYLRIFSYLESYLYHHLLSSFVMVLFHQLYLETVQDLLAPEKDNIPIMEDPKSGDVSLTGATMVQVHDRKDFLQLLQTGEANRFAANTKLNTESSRSHAILLVSDISEAAYEKN